MGSFVDQQQQNVALKMGMPPVNGLYVEQGTATAGSLAGATGGRKSDVKVPFKKAFNAVPVVTANLKMIDFANANNLRADVAVSDVTKADFVCTFQTWHDSTCYNMQANWLAIGSSD